MLLAQAFPEIGTDLEDQPLFTNLSAVREDRYVVVDLVTVSALCTPMLRGIRHALDQLVPAFERALQ